MAERYPEEPSIESAEGDAVHWAGAELLRGKQVALGQVAGNGVMLTDEMVDTATQYAHYIGRRDSPDRPDYPGCRGHIENGIRNAVLHVDNYGTPDYWYYNDAIRHLKVDDLKNGHGFVSEFDNWQLINYVALVAKHLGIFDEDDVTVTMTIHQPRAFHRRGPHRSVTTTLGALRDDFNQLDLAFAHAMYADAPVIASDPDQCMNCPGRVYCEAAIAAGYVGVDMAYESTPLAMSPAALSKEYRTLVRAEKMIKARREGIAESIKATIRRGQAVPFFTMLPTRGRTVWRDDAVDNGLVDVAQAFNVTVTKPALITPRQAVIAGIPEEVIATFSTAGNGAAELVEEDGSEAARVFGQHS